jgi:Ran GTPase-activating protein (RanGAP) involved in mRNA processing and transport
MNYLFNLNNELIMEIDNNINNLYENIKYNNFNLINLDISSNNIKDDNLKIILKGIIYNKTIKILDLSRKIIFFLNIDNLITGKGCEEFIDLIKYNTCLNTLILNNNFIGNIGCKHLFSEMNNNFYLSNLNLSGNNYY